MRTAAISVLLLLLTALTAAAQSTAPATAASPSTQSASPRRQLIAAGSDAGLWLVQVLPAQGDQGVSTVLRYRAAGETTWREAGRLNGRTVDAASRGSEVAILKDDGDWLLVSGDSSVTGPRLPGDSRLRSLAADSDGYWAIGEVRSELPATAPATKSATRSTAASLQPEAVTRPAIDPHLALFQLSPTGWRVVARLPIDLDAQASFVLHQRRPMIAARSGGDGVRLYDMAAYVQTLRKIDAGFDLLSTDSSLLLWHAAHGGAGSIVDLRKPDSSALLQTPESLVDDAGRTAIVSGGRLRLFFTRIDRSRTVVAEQVYDLSGFEPVGTPIALSFPVPTREFTILNWLQPVVIAAIVFAMIASFQHRRRVREMMESADPPAPAPLLHRLAAALIDCGPALVVFLVGFGFVSTQQDVVDLMQDTSFEILLLVSFGVHLLYNGLMECLVGRTAGKMVMNLRVITLEGDRPTANAMLLRNVLRIVELVMLPMAGLVIISPIRQRAGDIAAGTMVVKNEPAKQNEEKSEV